MEPTTQRIPLRSAYKQREYRRHGIYAWLFILAQAAVVIALLFFFLITPVKVTGESMEPTLSPGDVLLIDRLSLYLRTPQRGNIVIFHHPHTGEPLIKRVVALGGETIEITGGKVYINGRLLDESSYSPESAADYPATLVEDGCVFVLGDQREKSLDSRSESLGCVPLSLLYGRVRLRVAPIDRPALFV
ncbi:signal peptidase I [Eubacteriales bacterium OttesenSCG-928-K08]|nr:signal peptidase I [Eubacteriales bacterium OttesenSCG-928-K08]